MADHYFEGVADHLGAAYLRYSFTKGTAQEVAFLTEAMGLRPGHRVLDVGCGPGRHAIELAKRGIEVVGIDISHRFVSSPRTSRPTPASPPASCAGTPASSTPTPPARRSATTSTP